MPARTHGTVTFFVLTYAITGCAQLPAVLAHIGVLDGSPDRFMPLVGLGALGPLLGAVIAIRLERGSLRALFRPLLAWKVGARFLLAALLVPGVLLATGLALHHLLGGDPRPLLYPPTGPRLIALFLFPFAEEMGWRGLALPRLQARYGAIRASVVLGVLWAVWHIPMFIVAGLPPWLMAMMLAFFVPGSLFFTWLFNRTGGSLFVAVLAHMGAHLNNSHIPLPGDPVPAEIHTVAFLVLAVVLLTADRVAFRASPAS